MHELRAGNGDLIHVNYDIFFPCLQHMGLGQSTSHTHYLTSKVIVWEFRPRPHIHINEDY
jgi:hypothetical protein